MAIQFTTQREDTNYAYPHIESLAQDLDALRKYSFELLNKFRTVWNEAEYQEWCVIQRILHAKYIQH
jgi:hypothetical protein